MVPDTLSGPGSHASFLSQGREFPCLSPSQDEIVVRAFTSGHCRLFLLFCGELSPISLLISLPRGGAGLMRGIPSPQKTQNMELAVENSSSIEGAEVEGPCTMNSGMLRMQLSRGWA